MRWRLSISGCGHRSSGRCHRVSQFDLGEFTTEFEIYEVTYDEQPVSLTPKEYALLELLVSHGWRVLSQSGIIEHVWLLEDASSEEMVRSHMCGLRQKLKDAGASEDLIKTVHGVGYRLKHV